MGLWRGRASVMPWAIAAVAAALAQSWLPGKWYIVIGGLLGSVAGAVGKDKAASAQ